MLQVSELYIYPIKSLGGISVSAVRLTDRGFEHDRRWMLIDENNRFVSQRENAVMALLQVEILADRLKVYHKKNPGNFIMIPFLPASEEQATVTIWSHTCDAQFVSTAADEWFSKVLNMHCRLVYMADNTIVKVEEKYALNNDLNSFSDGFPVLMISRESLDDLNSRMIETLPMNRFRPNLVFTGAGAFIEDTMQEFLINGCSFYGISPSARCVITTIDQDTIAKGKEPLKTLAAFRKKDANIYFGENVIADRYGEIKVGNAIVILKTKESPFMNQN